MLGTLGFFFFFFFFDTFPKLKVHFGDCDISWAKMGKDTFLVMPVGLFLCYLPSGHLAMSGDASLVVAPGRMEVRDGAHQPTGHRTLPIPPPQEWSNTKGH